MPRNFTRRIEVMFPIDDPALRDAQQRKDAVRAYELVYAALGA